MIGRGLFKLAYCLGQVLRSGRSRLALAVCMLAAASHAQACDKPVFLTLDTGGMQHAQAIADILAKHQVKATFFLSHEKTFRGDYALDDSWADYWRKRVAEGHTFGSHTWRHGRILSAASGLIRYRPQHHEDAARVVSLDGDGFCRELRRVEERFVQMTGRRLDPIWRAPGGYTTPESLIAAKRCGFEHVHWSPAGFLGDELPSDRYPNRQLLDKALRDIRPGDVLMAHLGIWSRKDPYAPMLDPLIAGLKSRGFCFRPIASTANLTKPIP
ncbi:MAG: hypothetical protein RL676_716 [Pseudomonadota bacterium]|jgi:peptidoglycan/xylan/chitin deacetylase (PgdA/CDA1 family)